MIILNENILTEKWLFSVYKLINNLGILHELFFFSIRENQIKNDLKNNQEKQS